MFGQSHVVEEAAPRFEPLEPRLLLAADLASDLIALWSLDEGAGPVAADTSASVHRHDGTLQSGVAWEADGRFDGALRFDGVDDRVAVANHNEINASIQGERTIAFWFNVDDASISSRKQVIYEEGAQVRGLNIYVYDGRLYVGGWNQPGGESGWAGTWLSTDAIEPGRWHHVALTLSGGGSLLPDAMHGYLDGEAFGSGAGSQLWTHTGDVTIGRSGDTRFHDGAATPDGHGFAGLLDDGRLYNRALDADDIAVLGNTAPVASDDAFTAGADAPVQASVLANDTDVNGDALTVSLVTGPSHGTLTLSPGGGFTYRAADGFHGEDFFTYAIDDGRGGVAQATVTLRIESVISSPDSSASGTLVLALLDHQDAIHARDTTVPRRGATPLGLDSGVKLNSARPRGRVVLATRPDRIAPRPAPYHYWFTVAMRAEAVTGDSPREDSDDGAVPPEDRDMGDEEQRKKGAVRSNDLENGLHTASAEHSVAAEAGARVAEANATLPRAQRVVHEAACLAGHKRGEGTEDTAAWWVSWMDDRQAWRGGAFAALTIWSWWRLRQTAWAWLRWRQRVETALRHAAAV